MINLVNKSLQVNNETIVINIKKSLLLIENLLAKDFKSGFTSSFKNVKHKQNITWKKKNYEARIGLDVKVKTVLFIVHGWKTRAFHLINLKVNLL